MTKRGASARVPELCVLLAACGCLAGCGYPGDPLPPALNRPNNVRDLAAVERGDRIIVHFTVPQRTTENLPVKGTPDLELRFGAVPAGNLDLPLWERNSERVPAGAIHVTASAASAEIPAQNLYGKTVVLGVRAHGPGGRDIGWSNFEVVAVVPALPVPEGVEPKNAPDAVRLEWHATAPEFRIYRKGPEDTEFDVAGTSPQPFFLDSGIEFGKTYRYRVQSIEKTANAKYAESEISGEITFRPEDKFPPAVPSGLTAIPGTKTIELVWERNAEKDFAGYRIYRDGQKVAEGQSAPAFSDRDVKPGTRYRYQVSAVDTAGNESALSAAVETAIP
jgi:hypothetical protein